MNDYTTFSAIRVVAFIPGTYKMSSFLQSSTEYTEQQGLWVQVCGKILEGSFTPISLGLHIPT